MASRNGIHIFSGHYVVSINVTPFHVCTLNSKKLKGRTESYFTLFLKINNHQIRCFIFGLCRIHLTGYKFELFFFLNKSKTKPS